MDEDVQNIDLLKRRVSILEEELKAAKEQISLLNSELLEAEEGWSGEWEMDLLTKKTTWSPGFYQLLDYKESIEPDMKLFKDKMEPLGIDRLNGAINKTFISRKEYSFEHLIKKGDNEDLNARTDLKPIFNEQGQPIKLLGKLTDISSIKSASKELEKLSTIAANTSNAVVMLDVDAKIDWINSAFTVMTGYRPEEADKMEFDDLIISDDHVQCCADIFAAAFRMTNEVIQEIEIKTKKAEALWSVLNISPILDYELNPEGYIVIITDISDLKKAQKEIAEKNKEITDSITYAKRIQDAILPPTRLVTEYLPENFVLYKPKDIIAGDFYWMEKIDNQVIFAAADCTGHGVPGAMVSVVCHNALNRSVREFGLTLPGEILDKTRELVIRTFEKSDKEVKDGMDISICSFTPKTMKLKFAGANNGLYHIKNGELIEVKGDKQPIGKFALNSPFHTHEIQLSSGDSIYMTTDGFADQFGGPSTKSKFGGKKFKYKPLKELILKNINLPLANQKEALNIAFDEWRGSHEQVDDVCIWGVRF